jgi:hypothetical protein
MSPEAFWFHAKSPNHSLTPDRYCEVGFVDESMGSTGNVREGLPRQGETVSIGLWVEGLSVTAAIGIPPEPLFLTLDRRTARSILSPRCQDLDGSRLQ